MSYGAEYPNKASFYANEPSSQYGFIDAKPEVAEAFAQARKAAQLLFEGGTLGSEKDFQIHIYGHANPGHEPQPLYANDCVSITVTQLNVGQSQTESSSNSKSV